MSLLSMDLVGFSDTLTHVWGGFWRLFGYH